MDSTETDSLEQGFPFIDIKRFPAVSLLLAFAHILSAHQILSCCP